MKIFVVKYTHPNEVGWLEELEPHIHYLEALAAEGSLLASGPIIGAEVKSALLILSSPDESKLRETLAKDPYMFKGLVGECQIDEWQPIFGTIKDVFATS